MPKRVRVAGSGTESRAGLRSPPIEGVITLFEPSPSGSSVHVVVDFGFTYDPANVDVAVI